MWQARLDWTSHETLTGFTIADLSQRELIVEHVAIQPSDGLPKPRQTCLICHHKSIIARVLEDTHGHHDAGCRSGGPGPPRRHRGRAARDRAGRGRDRQRRRNAALRVRWPDGLSPAADGRGAARHHRTGLAGPEILLRAGHQGGAARLRHLAVRRRAAAGRRRAAGARQVQAHPRDRFRQPRGGDRARRHQPRHQPGGGACRLLLRARSVVADRLLDRRQCRGKFRRRALPEIRHDHQQRARLRDRADDAARSCASAARRRRTPATT